MIICSYFTISTPYSNVIQECLLPGLKKFNLPYDIEGISDRGSWAHNTAYKSKFILEMLLKHKQDICFIDADGDILKYPSLLFNIPDEYDIAIHWLLWDLHWHNKENNDHLELLSGTMVIKYKKRTIELLKIWIKAVEENIQKKEQKILQDIIEKNSKYKVYNLPVEYCVVPKHDGEIPKYINEPIIYHHQASRKFKRRSNWPKVDNST